VGEACPPDELEEATGGRCLCLCERVEPTLAISDRKVHRGLDIVEACGAGFDDDGTDAFFSNPGGSAHSHELTPCLGRVLPVEVALERRVLVDCLDELAFDLCIEVPIVDLGSRHKDGRQNHEGCHESKRTVRPVPDVPLRPSECCPHPAKDEEQNVPEERSDSRNDLRHEHLSFGGWVKEMTILTSVSNIPYLI